MWTRKAEGTSTAERRRTIRLSWKPKIRKEIRKVRRKSVRKKAMTEKSWLSGSAVRKAQTSQHDSAEWDGECPTVAILRK